MRHDPLAFRPDDDLHDELTSRVEENNSPGRVAKRDLKRYYRALRESCPVLPGPEAMTLVCCLNNIEIQDFLLTAQALETKIESAPDICFEVIDRAAFIERVKGWDLFTRLAVLDAAERYWHCSQSLEDVGLVASDVTV